MIGESIIITALLLIIIITLLKSKRKKWAVATLPVMLLPAVNAMSKPFCVLVLRIDFTFVIAVWTILIAVMASCIWTGFLTATLLNRRKTRLAYLFGCTAFNIILAAAFMWNHYHALGGELKFF